MLYYVSNSVTENGNGTKERPFKTISAAAQAARAGDEVIVAPGIYREHIDPQFGGAGEDARITYRAEQAGRVFVKGSEIVDYWENYQGNVWKTEIPNSLFAGDNPYTTEVYGDWFTPSAPVHTGEMFLNNRAMYEVQSLEQILHPQPFPKAWEKEESLYQWYTEQEGENTVMYANFQGQNPNCQCVEITVRRHCFYPLKTGINYITVSGFVFQQAAPQWALPTAYQEGMVGPHWSKGWIIEDCEISGARCVGISLGKYLQPNNNNRWRREYLKDGTQTEREAVCQAQRESWSKENIGSHIIRRCDIHDCGQAGIAGHLGGVFSVIEDNHIHHICNKGDLSGCEIAGIKLHAAIDVQIRRNHIHHCARGIWLDWQAQGTRISCNVFHHNTPPMGGMLFDAGEDVFVEVSHGPTLIDHNIMLTDTSLHICSQGITVAHNLLTGLVSGVGYGTDNGGGKLPTPRYTPYHVPHGTEIAGFMTILHGDIRFYNNVFIQRPITEADLQMVATMKQMTGVELPLCCGTKPYDGYPTADEYFHSFTEETYDDYLRKDIYYDHLPVYTSGNVFYNGALPCDTEQEYLLEKEQKINIQLREKGNGYILYTDLYKYLSGRETEIIDTERMGIAFEPEQKFENPDETPIIMDEDMLSRPRSEHPLSRNFGETGCGICKTYGYF